MGYFSLLFKPEVLYSLYLFTFPYFSYKYYKNAPKSNPQIISYLFIIGTFYAWLYFIGNSVPIFQYPILCVLGIVQILKLIALNHFLEKDKVEPITRSYRNYHLFLVSPAEVIFDPPKTLDIKHITITRLLRGSIQLVALFFFNHAISYTCSKGYCVSALPFLVRGAISGIQLSLCFQSLTDLSLTFFGFLFPDIYLEDVFKYPILSCSPREFWSKRWNLVIQRYICKIMYIPLGGKNNKTVATIAIYLTVGVLHEVPMLFLPSAKFGYWMLIFSVHIVAMLAQCLVEKAQIWALISEKSSTKLAYRICTLGLLAATAELAYSGFGLSAERMARDFNSLIVT